MSPQSHIKNQQPSQIFWYSVGIVGSIPVFGSFLYLFNFHWSIVLSFLFCIGVLIGNVYVLINASISSEIKDSDKPENPKNCCRFCHVEKVYEYVERNSYYLIIAIAFFLSAYLGPKKGELPEAGMYGLIVCSQASSLVCCVLAITLIWMPTPGQLATLKHFKTVIYTFAISFFLVGPLQVIIAMAAKVPTETIGYQRQQMPGAATPALENPSTR